MFLNGAISKTVDCADNYPYFPLTQSYEIFLLHKLFIIFTISVIQNLLVIILLFYHCSIFVSALQTKHTLLLTTNVFIDFAQSSKCRMFNQRILQ